MYYSEIFLVKIVPYGGTALNVLISLKYWKLFSNVLFLYGDFELVIYIEMTYAVLK